MQKPELSLIQLRLWLIPAEQKAMVFLNLQLHPSVSVSSTHWM